MKKATRLAAILMLTTTAAQAGGLDRGANPYSVLFESGNYVELSFSSVRPKVSGAYPAALGGGETGDMSEDYISAGLALKYQLNNQFDIALFLNKPYGADAAYSQGLYDGLAAKWDSDQIAIVAKYQVNPNVSVYGGVRSVESRANVTISDPVIRGGIAQQLQELIAAAAAAGDTATVTTRSTQLAGVASAPDGTFDYVGEIKADRQNAVIIGAAYEKPEIALRVGVTYEGGMTHEFDTTETYQGVTSNGTTEVDIPESIAIDFQSGVAADTLVFGSVRWSDWSIWEVRPPVYDANLNAAIVSIDNKVITYRLGVGRKINDQLSVFGRLTYEKSNGGTASRLAPTDGTTSVGVGGSYTTEGVRVTGGLEYAMLGDAVDGSGVEFKDNTALGMGLSVGFGF